MSKKKGSKDGSGDVGDDSEVRIPAELSGEILETKVRYLSDKVASLKSKCDTLTSENETLATRLSRYSTDKEDIVEFLNLRVNEHERYIQDLDGRYKALDADKNATEKKYKDEIDRLTEEMRTENENLQMKYTAARNELDSLSEFRAKKEDIEGQVRNLKATLERKEKEYRDTVYGLERKMLQDKNQIKKDMLHRVNEAVAAFRRVADQQMAETTKRAIRENMAISSQLKKMSSKMVDLLAQNDQLTAQVAQLRRDNFMLAESEGDLGKKNNANQRVIKMLVDRLKESDKMLEMAYQIYQSTAGQQQQQQDEFYDGQQEGITEEEYVANQQANIGAIQEAEELGDSSGQLAGGEAGSLPRKKSITSMAAENEFLVNRLEQLQTKTYDFLDYVRARFDLDNDAILANVDDAEEVDGLVYLATIIQNIQNLLDSGDFAGGAPRASQAESCASAHAAGQSPASREGGIEASTSEDVYAKPQTTESKQSFFSGTSDGNLDRSMFTAGSELIPNNTSSTNPLHAQQHPIGIDVLAKDAAERYSSIAKAPTHSVAVQTDSIPSKFSVSPESLLADVRGWGKPAATIPLRKGFRNHRSPEPSFPRLSRFKDDVYRLPKLK